MDNLNYGIGPNPFDKLNETELLLLLNNKDLTPEQRLLIEAKLSEYRIEREQNLTTNIERPKVYVKKTKNSGYVDIIILMLTVWLTCLCGFVYVYSQIIG